MVQILRILGGEKLPEKDVIPTPSRGLNYNLGGGLWSGRFHFMWGNHSGGKTTFFLKTMANAQALGYTPIIIDAEGSYHDEWGAKNGIDVSKRVYYRTNVVQDLTKEFPFIDKTYEKYILLIDSVNALVSEKYYDGDRTLAGGATAQKEMLTSVAKYVDPRRSAVFMIAQQSIHGIGTRIVKPDANMGNAAGHWATNIIKLNNSTAADNLERDKDTGTILNKKVTWTIQKCKQAPVEGTKGHYWFDLGNAKVDMANEVADIAVHNGIIKQSGAWFKWDGEQYQGLKNLVAALDEEKIDKILSELKGKKVHFDVAPDETLVLGK